METSSYVSSIALIQGLVALYMIGYIFVVYIALPVAAMILSWAFINLTIRVFKK